MILAQGYVLIEIKAGIEGYEAYTCIQRHYDMGSSDFVSWSIGFSIAEFTDGEVHCMISKHILLM